MRSKFYIIFYWLLLTVVSVANYCKAQNTAGDSIFNTLQVHDVHINFPQSHYWDSLTANYTADVYMKCDVVVDGINYGNIGAKFKGNSSYNNQSKKKSFKIGFDEFVDGQKINGLKKFNLNNGFKDPTFMREKLMLDFANQMGAVAPRCSYARVYLNNVYWGLYTLVEEIDKRFLDNHYPDKKGNLFKGDPSGDLKWMGSAPSLYYNKYELKTNETANNWNDLVRLIDKINNTPNNFYDSLERVLNTTSVLQAWALTNIFSDLDSYLGSGHNYFLYEDSTSLKFNYILWDVNEAFGNFNMGMNISQMESLSMYFMSNPGGNRPLYSKMLANTSYKAKLTEQFCNMVPFFTNALLDPKIDSIKQLINADVLADTLKFYSYNDFINNINSDITSSGPPPSGGTTAGLKSFIQARHNFLVNELASNNCTAGLNESASLKTLNLSPNPSNNGNVLIKSDAIFNNVKVIDVVGKALLTIYGINNTSYLLNLSEFANGVYFIQTDNTNPAKFVLSK